MFINPIFIKSLFAGFMNGLYIGRKLRYGRKEHIHRFCDNSKQQFSETKAGIRTNHFEKKFNLRLVKNN